MNKIDFFREGIKNLRTIGTVTRSSKYLCNKIVSLSSVEKSKYVVELGAGDGVMTRHILKRMAPDAQLMCFEINTKFCDLIRKINDPRLIVIEDSAEHLSDHLRYHAFDRIDTVFSAIPFVVLPDDLAHQIVQTCQQKLRTRGEFLQIHYSLIERNLYKEIFGNLAIKFHLLNIPPAFILCCTKEANGTAIHNNGLKVNSASTD